VAQIQFLNGARDAEVQDLVEEAGLNLGSADGSYITVKDAAIDPRHAVIYSVKGQFYVKPESANAKCFVNFRPVPLEGQGIADRDILMFGRTLAKFWRAQAPAGAMGGATLGVGGGDSAKLTKERDDARAQVADLQQKLQQASSGASAAATAQIDALKRDKDAVSKEKDALAREKDAVSKEKDDLAKQLDGARQAAKRDLDAANQAKADVERARDDAQAKLKTVTDERDAAKKAEEKTREDLDAERKRAEAAEQEAQKAKPELEKKDQELEAVRKALDALRASEEVAKRDRRAAIREGSDLGKILGALAVPESLRDRIAAALQDEVDRAVIGRDGATVPLRGLRCPGCDADLESELSTVKAMRRQAEALRALGAAALSADEVRSLVERVRSGAKA
jgi:predicted  nucleic acid-binding Zn-ribbon protein